MTTKQGRGVTQAVAFDAATVGGAWVGVWGSIGELGAHYMCEVRFGSVLRFQLGVQKGTLLPKMKMYVCSATLGTFNGAATRWALFMPYLAS